MTLNEHWGWHAGDRPWKALAQVIRNLVRCASGGSNFLLIVDPMPDGAVPPASAAVLEATGHRPAANGGSICASVLWQGEARFQAMREA